MASQKGLARCIHGTKWEEHAAKKTLSSKTDIQNGWRDKELPRPTRFKRVWTTKLTLQEILRGGSIKEEKPKNIIEQKCMETIYRNKDFTGNTTSIKTYLSIITLNVNDLNVSIKWHSFRLDKMTGPIHMLSKRDPFGT